MINGSMPTGNRRLLIRSRTHGERLLQQTERTLLLQVWREQELEEEGVARRVRMFLCRQNHPIYYRKNVTHVTYFCLVKTSWLRESFVLVLLWTMRGG